MSLHSSEITRLRFTKMQGAGNDFVMVDGFEESLPEHLLPEAARFLCDRHFGIGADGLILVLPSRTCDFRMRMFNPDGSEAEMCGNGIRCFAQFVRSRDLTTRTILDVETLAGTISPRILPPGPDGPQVQVDMGSPRFGRDEIPVLGSGPDAIRDHLTVNGVRYEFTAVSMGNPHCVIFVDDVETFPLEEVGPRIETADIFPRRTNVEFVQVLSSEWARMRVWERGAGETLACGTGACAAAVACAVNGRTCRKVQVDLSGGTLVIEWTEANRVLMTGPAVEVFSGEVWLPDSTASNSSSDRTDRSFACT